MFSAISTASYTVGAWQKQVLCFRFLHGRLGFWKASYWRHVRRKCLCQLSLQNKRTIYLTKTQFQLHNMLRYSGLLRVRNNFFGAGANWRLKYFSESLDRKRRRQIVSINFSFTAKLKTRSFSERFFCKKIFLLLNDRKSQIPNIVCLRWSFRQIYHSSLCLDTSQNIFPSYMPSVRSLPKAAQST